MSEKPRVKIGIPKAWTEFFQSRSVGDLVRVQTSPIMSTELLVTEMTPEFIVCGDRKFSKNTGAEVDERRNWTETRTGAYLTPNELKPDAVFDLTKQETPE